MREIVHIQAGSFSNFIGTHYFNTLESYLSSEDEEVQNSVDHGISFREGVALDGTETYCPRLLLFDYKPNFGALSAVSALYRNGGGSLQDEDGLATWCETTYSGA